MGFTLPFSNLQALQEALTAQNYIADRSLATTLYLALVRQRPLLLEGEPGVGKTEIARVLASLLQTPLLRLQCYEGVDLSSAAYEWNYTRQLLAIRLLETQGKQGRPDDIFTREYLLARPLLRAIDHDRPTPPVLLIDELDRSDEEFEAYLLELLSDYQITIPELGTISAKQPPIVIITSNRTRDIHDALRRRCLYHWIDYPDPEKELAIVRARLPEAPEQLSRQVCEFVHALRSLDLYKAPGIAETLDWLGALLALQHEALTLDNVGETLGALLKYQDDVLKMRGSLLEKLVAQVQP